MTTESSFGVCLLGLTLAAAVGCRTAFHSDSLVDEARIPAELRSDYAVFAVNCSKCHGLARALNAPIHEVEHWDRYVARMARTAGSGISPQESPRILRFLHWYTLAQSERREEKP